MEIRETPSLTPESVSLLENIIESNDDVKILEFGCGGSTLWFSGKINSPACRLVSVEHDADLYQAVKSKVSGDVEMRLEKAPYAEVCNEFPDEYFDLALIDGQHNILCAAHAMRVIKPNGFLMLGNADHAEYDPIRTVLLKEWDYKRNANYLASKTDIPPTTDIWRKPLMKNVADVPDEMLVAHAETSIHAGDYQQAEILARLSIERSANIANALNLLAVISSTKNKPMDAYRMLEAASILEPTNLNVNKNLAQILVGLDRREEALEIYNRLLTSYPDDADIAKGIAQWEGEAPAEPACSGGISDPPVPSPIHNSELIIQNSRSAYPDAILRLSKDEAAQPTQEEVIEETMESKFFDKGKEATPQWLSEVAMRINHAQGNQQTLIDIAGELAERGHENTAEELARAIIRDNPNFAEAHNLLGIVYFSRDRHEDALRYFDTAYRLEPQNSDIGKNLVSVQVHFAQYEEAIETCQMMITHCPKDEELVQIIGELLQTISDEAFSGMDMSQFSEAAELDAPAPMQHILAKQTKFQPKLKYSFGIMVSNANEPIESALKSIYDIAHEIIVLEGPVGDCASKTSGDKAIKMIQEFPDPDNKMSVVRGKWADKTEQSNAYMKMATGDYVWEINPGETYNWEDLINLDEILADNQDCVDMVSFTAVPKLRAMTSDKLAQEKSEPRCRVFKREPDCYFSSMTPPRMVYSNSAKERGCLEADTLVGDFSIYMYIEAQPKTKKISKKQLAKL
ncbi:MAG: tetratricopeptide repeat protein [Armatimonadetes bacterium]|nr:tetratricopeptide repeat protein [Armatimonadota bacterium]